MAVNDTILLAIRGTVGGQTHVHTLHFREMAVAADEQGLIDEWQAACMTPFRGMFDNDDTPVILATASQVCGATPLRAPVEEAVTPPGGIGTLTLPGDRVPSWLAAVVSVRTAVAGRSRRGRFYIGGLFEDVIHENSIDAAHLLRVKVYTDALMATFGPGGTMVANHALVVHSPKLASVPGTQCQNSSTIVTALLPRTLIGSMKSRKPGSGT